MSEPVINAIAEGKRPAGLQPDEQAVYDFCAELLRTYYQTVAMLLNTDRYPLPDGIAPEL